ncbi:MAG: EFR1 family ferrodoxin [Clostridium sp.]|nr:EFR1 family ferrodoxin [Clostridium sp.]
MFTIVQFSPTGNTAHIANLLSEHLNSNDVYALEHTAPETLVHSEHLVILFAIHAFNAPKTVMRFVKALPKNNFKKVSLIGVGCNDIWVNYGASKEIRKSLEEKSCQIVVDEIIAMPLTFIMSFPEDVINAQLEKAHNITQIIASNILNGVVSDKQIPFKSHLLSLIGKIEPAAARFFGLELHAKKSCNQCGLCVRECPEGNIHLKANGKIRFGFKCIMCMRCIYNCPQKAIAPRISKFIPIKKGYSIDRYVSKNSQNKVERLTT